MGLALLFVSGCVDAAEPALSEQTQEAGGGCKSDHTVTTPARITSVTLLSSRKVHVTATPGSDPNGPVTLGSYNFRDASLTTHPVWPASQFGCGGASIQDNAYDMTMEGLVPGATYTLTLDSHDACNNYATSAAWNVTMPAAVSESTAPVTSTPCTTPVNTFQGPREGVVIYAADNTGMDHVDFFANGAPAGSYSYTGSSDVHGYTQAAGDDYWIILDASLYGTTATIESRAYDVFGNMTSHSAVFAIPTP